MRSALRDELKIGTCVLAEKAKRHRTDSTPSMPLMRMREIETVIRSRYGRIIPDPEDTDDRSFFLDMVLAAALSTSAQDMAQWCRRWAPWANHSEINEIEARSAGRKRMISADAAAGLLCVTFAERTALALKTIGACDMEKEERQAAAKRRKRDRDREAKAAKRLQQGRRKREAYEASSLARNKPWEADGISRAEWYRRRETSVSRIEERKNGDTPVSQVAHLIPCPSSPRDGREADSLGVRGPCPRRRVREAEPHGNGEHKEHAA